MRLLMLSGDRQAAAGRRGPLVAMLSEFSRHFERIDVLSPRPDGPVVVSELFDRVHLHPAQCGRVGMFRHLTHRGAELIAEHHHELIVSHDYGWFYNGLAAWELSRRTGVPYVSEIHHVPGHPVAADLRERFDKLVARSYVRWARSRARAFRVVNSGEMVPLLESWGVPRAQIAVLPSLYIDLALFSPPPQPVAAEQDVLFVGRMVNNKGLDRIVDALAIAAEKGRAWRALFVGKGPLAERTRHRVRERGLAGHVRFVEWIDNLDELARVYRSSRTIVCASTCEGGPRVTVEAMACGVPATSTPVGMMRELLRDGENGALASFDAPSLSAALMRVLDDEPARLAMGRAARRDAERFEYHRAIETYALGLQRIARGEVPQ